MATLVSINVSRTKGVRKTPVEHIEVGLTGLAEDAHAGDWHRMVSLLAEESIAKMQAAGLDVKAGDFAENLTTRGLDLLALPLGTRVQVGAQLVLEITQHGKECHQRCAIYYQAGDCIMPKEGVFAKVIQPGQVHRGDPLTVQEAGDHA